MRVLPPCSPLVLLLASGVAPRAVADDAFSLADAPRVSVVQTKDGVSRLHAHAAAFADFDEDGDGDLVQAVAGLGLGLAENVGGEFTWTAIDPLTGLGAFNGDLEAGDFDGDGHQDVAMAAFVVGNPAAGVLRVFRGDGKGAFAALPDVPLPSFLSAVHAGNLDGDGKDDLVVTFQNRAEALLVTGGGAVASFDLGVIPFEAHLADVDGNGADDLAVGTGTSGGLRIFLNDGAGGLQQVLDLGPSGVAFGFLAADLDGDGDRDVVSTRTATPSGGTDLLVFENLGGAQFAAPLTVKFLDAFAVTTSMVAGDLDRDGDTDLVVATDAGGAGSVSAWFGDGALGFAAQGGVSLFARALWLTETVVEGEAVLLSGDAHVVPIRPDGRLGGVPLPTSSPGIRPIVVTDVDGDGLDDVVALNAAAQALEAYLADGERGFVPLPPVAIAGGASRLAAADLDGDGVDDVVVWGNASAAGVLNTPAGLAPASPSLFSVAWVGYEGAVGDVDGDGRDDLVLAQKYDSPSAVGLSNGDGTFTEKPLLLDGPPGELLVMDVDGDGLEDLVYASKLDGRVRIQRATGGGAFAAAIPVGPVGSGSYAFQIDGGDADGDGDLDVVRGTLGGFDVLRNDGSLLFTPTVGSSAFPFAKEDVNLVDMNGDGLLDVQLFVSGGSLRSIVLVENQGGGAFASSGVVHDVASVVGCVVADSRPGDFDGDGLPDVAVSIHAHDGAVASSFVYFNDAMLRKRGVPGLGGSVELSLDAPAAAGSPYLLLAGAKGRWPGVDLGADRLPLNADPALWPLSLTAAGVFQGFFGILDADGRATARLVLPQGFSLGAALPLDFAFVSLESGTATPHASNAVEVVLE